MASLTKKGEWYSLLFYDAARTPSRKKVALRTRTKREAEALRRALEDGAASGRFDPWTDDPVLYLRPAAPAPTPAALDLTQLGRAVDAFLADKDRLRPTTAAHYRGVMGLLVRHVGRELPVGSLTAAHVLSFLDSTRCNATSRRNYCLRIGVFCRWLLERGAVTEDVTRRVPLERAPDKFAQKLISPAQLVAIVTVAEASRTPYIADVARVTFSLALRLGEVCAMRRSWVDLDTRRLTIRQSDGFVTKTGRDLTKPIPQDAYDVLVRRCAALHRPDDLVFINSRGNALNPKWTSKRFKAAVRAAGLPESLHFHGLRHGGISRVVAGGASIEAARRFAGHTSVEMTMRYAHLLDRQYEEQVLTAVGG